MSDEMLENMTEVEKTEAAETSAEVTEAPAEPVAETADSTSSAEEAAPAEKPTEEKPKKKKSSSSSSSKSGSKSSGKKSGGKSTGKKKKKKKKKKVVLKRSQAEIKNQTRRTLEAMAFALPWLIGLCVFFAYPLISSFRLSFSQITKIAGWEMKWVGFQNYAGLFNDSNFTSAFANSLKDMVIFVPSVVILAMIIAVLLNTKMAFRGVFRSIFFLPVLLGAGYILQQLLGENVDAAAAEAGYTMATEMTRGIEMPQNLQVLLPESFVSVIEAIFSQITKILWRSGVQILIFLSGLQSISDSVYESARVDGATEWEMFWKITIPSLAPVTLLTIVYTIVDCATDTSSPIISLIVTTTSGGGADSNMGSAAAMSWIYLAVVLAMIGIVMFATRKTGNNASDN